MIRKKRDAAGRRMASAGCSLFIRILIYWDQEEESRRRIQWVIIRENWFPPNRRFWL